MKINLFLLYMLGFGIINAQVQYNVQDDIQTLSLTYEDGSIAIVSKISEDRVKYFGHRIDATGIPSFLMLYEAQLLWEELRQQRAIEQAGLRQISLPSGVSRSPER